MSAALFGTALFAGAYLAGGPWLRVHSWVGRLLVWFVPYLVAIGVYDSADPGFAARLAVVGGSMFGISAIGATLAALRLRGAARGQPLQTRWPVRSLAVGTVATLVSSALFALDPGFAVPRMAFVALVFWMLWPGVAALESGLLGASSRYASGWVVGVLGVVTGAFILCVAYDAHITSEVLRRGLFDCPSMAPRTMWQGHWIRVAGSWLALILAVSVIQPGSDDRCGEADR